MHRMVRIPPVEYENLYCATKKPDPGLHTCNRVFIKPQVVPVD